MSSNPLRRQLIASLQNIYELEAFGALRELLQGEFLTLHYLLAHREEIVYPSQLSQELQLSRSRVTGTLNSLGRKGLLSMEHSQQDRRRIQVSITEAGVALIQERMARMERYFDQMIAGLGQEDTLALIGLIDRCVEVMENDG